MFKNNNVDEHRRSLTCHVNNALKRVLRHDEFKRVTLSFNNANT